VCMIVDCCGHTFVCQHFSASPCVFSYLRRDEPCFALPAPHWLRQSAAATAASCTAALRAPFEAGFGATGAIPSDTSVASGRALSYFRPGAFVPAARAGPKLRSVARKAGSASRHVSPHRGSVEGYLFLRGRSWRPCRPQRREVGLGEESKKSLGCLCSARLYLHQTPGICAVVGSGKLPFSYWQHSSHGFRSESVTHQGKASSTFAVFWLSI
jgi:hypothetical protein